MRKVIIAAIITLAFTLCSCASYSPGHFEDDGVRYEDGTFYPMPSGGGEGD